MESHMSSTLYTAAKEGDVDYLSPDTLWKKINVSSDTPSEERDEKRRCHFLSLTQEKNNCMHIAARYGHEKFVSEVLSLFHSLVYQKNERGDNPLHVAARAGHLNVVKLIIGSFQPSSQGSRRTGNGATTREEADEEGNKTAIQNQADNGAALGDSVKPPTSQSQSISGNSAAAGVDDTNIQIIIHGEAGEGEINRMTLTDSNQPSQKSQSESTISSVTATETIITSEWPYYSLPVWRSQNNDGNTALHEALRSRRKVALHLLEIPDCEPVVLVANAKDESPLYLAAEAGFEDVLTKILEILKAEIIQVLHDSIPGLIREKDSFGKTALYYATQDRLGNLMDKLLELDSSSACICDSEGLSPLLVASSLGHSDSIKTILHYCPASIDSHDKSGRNALHLAVLYNNFRTFKKLLAIRPMMDLINEPDKVGNTPMHLATMALKCWHVLELLQTERVDLTTKNNDGNTALDLCLLEQNFSYQQKLIRRKLESREASRGRVRLLKLDDSPVVTKMDKKDMKHVINTLSVVATLLATITFAAAFTILGGYKIDGPYEGSPVLIKRTALQVFFLSDTVALCFSMWALLVLIAAASNETSLQAAIIKSKNLLAIALYTAMIAFVSGLYVAVQIQSTWVAILVCIIGSTLSYLFVPDMVKGLLTNLTPWYERLRQYYSNAIKGALPWLLVLVIILISPLLILLAVLFLLVYLLYLLGSIVFFWL